MYLFRMCHLFSKTIIESYIYEVLKVLHINPIGLSLLVPNIKFIFNYLSNFSIFVTCKKIFVRVNYLKNKYLIY